MPSFLRECISLIIQEIKDPGQFHDRWFLEELPRALKEFNAQISQCVGHKLGQGNEAIVFKYEDDKAIRFEPCYDFGNKEEIIEKQKMITIRPHSPQVYDIGVINYIDENDEIQPLCVYTIMQLLRPLPQQARLTIDDVQTGKMDIEDVGNDNLRDFIEWYLEEGQDPSPDNVMIDDDGHFVAIDV